jgi:hypothetical protein
MKIALAPSNLTPDLLYSLVECADPWATVLKLGTCCLFLVLQFITGLLAFLCFFLHKCCYRMSFGALAVMSMLSPRVGFLGNIMPSIWLRLLTTAFGFAILFYYGLWHNLRSFKSSLIFFHCLF